MFRPVIGLCLRDVLVECRLAILYSQMIALSEQVPQTDLGGAVIYKKFWTSLALPDLDVSEPASP